MATQIIPNLWLGNIIDSRNSEFLKQIDVVINCSTNIPFYSKDTQNIRIRVEDNLEKEEIENMFKYLDNTADFLHNSRVIWSIQLFCIPNLTFKVLITNL